MIPLINGVAYASANVGVIIPIIGAVTGVIEINYNKEQQIDDNYALQQDPVSRGYGQNKYTGDITLYKEIWNKIIDASPGKDPAKLPFFDIIVTFGGAGVAFRKETLRAVNFKNNPMGVKGGDTKIVCKINLAIAGIDYA
jgi:hypothetical protein